MQAIIEREAGPQSARHEAAIAAVTRQTPRPYRAPMATFLVLMASARADAQSVEEAAAEGESA